MRILILFLLCCFGCEQALTEDEMNRRYRNPQVVLDIEERQRPRVPVIVSEPLIGEWSNNPMWGSGYNNPMPTSEGAEVPVFSLDRTYGPPAVHTINLFSSQNVGSSNSELRARVRFGAGAVQNELLFDWFQGAQFSIVADHFRITAVTYAPDGTAAYSAVSNDISLTASIAKGTAGGNSAPLTYTEPLVSIAGGGSAQTFTPPPFAKGLNVFIDGNDDPATDTSVVYTYFIAGQSLSGDCKIFAGSSGVLLPGGLRAVLITNNNVGAQKVVVQWILGL